ncbi:hypothetical protein HGRIS_000217 [Hohenbuehelia grisea]|uniref:Uncharacterized protein n=1 Tax=Hohenbuehelia grisea TaxID=104357 RepID=A0ABR3JR63_9AGAR
MQFSSFFVAFVACAISPVLAAAAPEPAGERRLLNVFNPPNESETTRSFTGEFNRPSNLASKVESIISRLQDKADSLTTKTFQFPSQTVIATPTSFSSISLPSILPSVTETESGDTILPSDIAAPDASLSVSVSGSVGVGVGSEERRRSFFGNPFVGPGRDGRSGRGGFRHSRSSSFSQTETQTDTSEPATFTDNSSATDTASSAAAEETGSDGSNDE